MSFSKKRTWLPASKRKSFVHLFKGGGGLGGRAPGPPSAEGGTLRLRRAFLGGELPRHAARGAFLQEKKAPSTLYGKGYGRRKHLKRQKKKQLPAAPQD